MIWLVIGYLICAFICYGIFFAYAQRNYPSIATAQYANDMGTSAMFGLILAIGGPFGIVATVLMTGFAHHGFKVK